MLNKSLYPCVIYNDKTNCRKQFTSIREELNDELQLHKQFDYYYNNFGFRSIHEEDYTLNDVNDIWCFGCSFTFGNELSDDKGGNNPSNKTCPLANNPSKSR